MFSKDVSFYKRPGNLDARYLGLVVAWQQAFKTHAKIDDLFISFELSWVRNIAQKVSIYVIRIRDIPRYQTQNRVKHAEFNKTRPINQEIIAKT